MNQNIVSIDTLFGTWEYGVQQFQSLKNDVTMTTIHTVFTTYYYPLFLTFFVAQNIVYWAKVVINS